MLVSISKIPFVSIKMLKFGEAKIAKEKFYAVKKPINIWDVNNDNLSQNQLKLKLVLSIWLDI